MADLTFMIDITIHLSTLSRTLQGKSKLCHELYCTVSGFTAKLRLWKAQIGRGTFSHLPSPSEHKDGGSN